MAWNDLASNQMVSFTDAQGGGFTLQSGQSNVTSNQCMTKNDALTKYVLDSSAMASYTSNQLVPKSAFVASSLNTITLRGFQPNGDNFQNVTAKVYKNGTEYLSTSCFANSSISCLVNQNTISEGNTFYALVNVSGSFPFIIVNVIYSSNTRGVLYSSGNIGINTSSYQFPTFTVLSNENVSVSVNIVG